MGISLFLKMKLALITFLLHVLLGSCFLFGQTFGQIKSVQLQANIQESTPVVTLNWSTIPQGNVGTIYRKPKDVTSWGSPIATVAGNATTWSDSAALVGVGYEYRITFSKTSSAAPAHGYIYAGYQIPEVHFRGNIILVYDTTFQSTFDNELNMWERDVIGDGYKVIRIKINRNDSVTHVKAKIAQEWLINPEESKSLFLFGRVPVPYSGNLYPDGHTPDHFGAWPADTYYGEMTSNWTDQFVSNIGASQERNRNIVGDGKFDQSNLPSDVEFEVGRVDMANLPLAGNEADLLKAYLIKNHAFRNKQFTPIKRAFITDNFTNLADGFSASAWRSFPTLTGIDSIATGNYYAALRIASYLWSYGCGAGGYSSASGVVSSSNIASDSLQSVFTMLFGSYFGDWDSPSNNLLRIALATGSTLTNAWSGRPIWHFHHMALGDNIGYSTKIAMNNSLAYDFNSNPRGVHIALMGDPSLRMEYPTPVTNLIAVNQINAIQLTWDDNDNALGYFVYRKKETDNHYILMNEEYITDLSFIDNCPGNEGQISYMVRPVIIQTGFSGSYKNLGTGQFADINYLGDEFVNVNFEIEFESEGFIVNFINSSTNSTSFEWNFGDGNTSLEVNPSHTYAQSGTYEVSLTGMNACNTETIFETITIINSNEINNVSIKIYPNPTNEYFLVQGLNQDAHIQVLDLQGRVLINKSIQPHEPIYTNELESGIYYVNVNYMNKEFVEKICVIK